MLISNYLADTHGLCKCFFLLQKLLFYPFAPGDVAEKLKSFLITVLLLRAKTYHKAGYRSYTSQPSDPDVKCQLANPKFGHAQRAKLRDTAVLTFTFLFLFLFLFLSILSSFFFLASLFFSLGGHLGGFILMAKVFRKAFKILGLYERKGRWEMEQDFH